MNRMCRLSLLVTLLLLAIVARAGSDAGHGEPVSTETIVIDVRTPSEFADGHLTHALNLDFRSAQFRDSIEAFDRGNVYVLYCRSGNRAEQAKQMMDRMGFKQVRNIGGVKEASKILGLEIIK